MAEQQETLNLATLPLLEWGKLFLLWYGIGIATILAKRVITNGELRVRDVDDAIKMGLFGPTLYIFGILSVIYNIFSSIQDTLTNNKNKVLS